MSGNIEKIGEVLLFFGLPVAALFALHLLFRKRRPGWFLVWTTVFAILLGFTMIGHDANPPVDLGLVIYVMFFLPAIIVFCALSLGIYWFRNVRKHQKITNENPRTY